ncbi:MAG: tRNA (N(6)-L-threonylcarbamoyladenosine(37)-C(2))-methylthiotransferase MtaB [Treponema sp.]|jgi:threonylcarbamoyladenosine tRNA methylthiotransferase MtaB|nr:tRNA (N(6)-L-threonylcarbamoyladenosine(37)-C(2))-methylthiotransferase MtaB [Treponema sp.]
MLALSTYTLGCKLNQLESESIADAFKREGFEILPWESGDLDRHGVPDILVVNTCTVTSKAEQKARRIIRKMLRDHPRAVIIVTGCYAQLEGERLRALEMEAGGLFCHEDRLFVVPGDHKSALLDLPRLLSEAMGGETHARAADPAMVSLVLPNLLAQWSPHKHERFRFNQTDCSFHSRAFLKIQDGCDNRCSYCRVSLARGPGVSLEAEQVLSALQALEAKGYGEAVLTGVNISRYRSGLDLAGLLGYLLDRTERIGLRLSSLEPEGMREDFITILAHPRIRPHFHLSVQSGSSRILEKMRRPYTPDTIEQGVSRLRSVKDDPFLASDIITGFPGETEAEFEKTYELCRSIGFAWIHAFPYSPRPGTEAYHFKEPVSEREAVARVERLLVLGQQGRQGYIHRWMGRTVEAIIESKVKGPGTSGLATGVSDNYLKLLITLPHEQALPPGSMVRCRLRSLPVEGEENSRFDALAERLE